MRGHNFSRDRDGKIEKGCPVSRYSYRKKAGISGIRKSSGNPIQNSYLVNCRI